MNFSDLGLCDELSKAVADLGYVEPTPHSAKIDTGRPDGEDILTLWQTGTGKTASFTLPMIEILASGRAKARLPRSLILAPTRELAAQVAGSFEKFSTSQTPWRFLSAASALLTRMPPSTRVSMF